MHEFYAMTFNVNGQVRFGWQQRASLSGKLVQESLAHVIGFQEFGVTTWDTYRSLLPDFDIYHGCEAGDIFINPIAWNKKRFAGIRSDTEWLSETPRQYSKGWDGSERGMSWTLLRDLSADRDLLHINVHLDNIGEKARVEGTKQVIAFANTYPRGLPTIITGDFNCSPYTPIKHAPYTRQPYDLFIGAGFVDASTNASYETAPYTFHGYQGERYVVDQYGTWHTDWIMVRNLIPLQHEIVRNETSSKASDHYPVIALLDYLPQS